MTEQQYIHCGGSGLVAKSCPTLCDLVNCSLPGYSVRGILQARILEWVAIFFSLVAVLGLLIAGTSLVAEDGL